MDKDQLKLVFIRELKKVWTPNSQKLYLILSLDSRAFFLLQKEAKMPEYLKLAVWQKAHYVYGYNPDLLRIDDYGNPIAFHDYGKNSLYSWEIDHIYPKSRGGSDCISNLRPLQVLANRMKGDRLPVYI